MAQPQVASVAKRAHTGHENQIKVEREREREKLYWVSYMLACQLSALL